MSWLRCHSPMHDRVLHVVPVVSPLSILFRRLWKVGIWVGAWRDAGIDVCAGTAYTGYRKERRKSNQTQGEARETTWKIFNWVLKISHCCQTEESKKERQRYLCRRGKGIVHLGTLWSKSCMKWDTVRESAWKIKRAET